MDETMLNITKLIKDWCNIWWVRYVGWPVKFIRVQETQMQKAKVSDENCAQHLMPQYTL